MTKHDLANRLRDELDAWAPGGSAFEPATVDDVEILDVAIREAIDDAQEVIASAARGKDEP